MFTPINTDSQKKFDEIVRRIKRLQSGGTIDSLINIGAQTNNTLGASFPSLKNLALQYEKDEQTALLLWGTERREEQIIACFLFPRDLIMEKIMQLLINCKNYEIATYFGSTYLAQRNDLDILLPDLCDSSSQPFSQTAGIVASAKYLIINKKLEQNKTLELKEYFKRTYTNKEVANIATRYNL